MKTLKYISQIIIVAQLVFSCTSRTEKIKSNTEVHVNAKAIKFTNKGLAFMSLTNKNSDSAFYYFNKAIAAEPRYYIPHVHKAELYVELGDDKNVLSELKVVTQLAPHLAGGWVKYGVGLDFYDEDDKSKIAYQRAVKLLNKKIETSSSEVERTNHLLNRGVALFLLWNSAYKKDFNALKQHKSYQPLLNTINHQSREKLLAEMMHQ